jgi:CBS domain-containing protein
MTPQPTTGEREAPPQLLARTSVRAAMQLGLFECDPDADVRTIARTMAERRIHAVVVADVAGPYSPRKRLDWGIVSDLDLMRALRPGLEGTTARELARTHDVAVLPTDTLKQAARLMTEHKTAHLVVVSPDTGRPVGMVSTLDIARHVGGV